MNPVIPVVLTHPAVPYWVGSPVKTLIRIPHGRIILSTVLNQPGLSSGSTRSSTSSRGLCRCSPAFRVLTVAQTSGRSKTTIDTSPIIRWRSRLRDRDAHEWSMPSFVADIGLDVSGTAAAGRMKTPAQNVRVEAGVQPVEGVCCGRFGLPERIYRIGRYRDDCGIPEISIDHDLPLMRIRCIAVSRYGDISALELIRFPLWTAQSLYLCCL